jgi:hypothetical protein
MMESDHSSSQGPLPTASPALGAAAPVAPVPWVAWVGPGSLLQDEMLLAPFLTTKELLRLSETAMAMLPYRTHLGRVTTA